MDNRYLVKMASWTREKKKFSGKSGPFSQDEIQQVIEDNNLDIQVLHADSDKEKATEVLKSLLPENKGRLAEALILRSDMKGPGYVPKHGIKGLKKDVIFAGGIENTTPVIHEIGHAIDSHTGSDFTKDLKQDSAVWARKAEKSGIPLIIGGAMTASSKLRKLAPVLPWAVRAPIIRGETAANYHAYKEVRDRKGEDAAAQYMKDAASPYGSYFKKPLIHSALLTGLAFASAHKGLLMKRAMLEKHGDPKPVKKESKLSTHKSLNTLPDETN